MCSPLLPCFCPFVYCKFTRFAPVLAAFYNPSLMCQHGGTSAVLKNVLNCHQLARINESLLSTVLYLLNHPKSRHNIREDLDIEVRFVQQSVWRNKLRSACFIAERSFVCKCKRTSVCVVCSKCWRRSQTATSSCRRSCQMPQGKFPPHLSETRLRIKSDHHDWKRIGACTNVI